MSSRRKSSGPGLREVYLAAYNTAQLAGWTTAAYLTLHGTVRSDGGTSVYSSAGSIVSAFLHVSFCYKRAPLRTGMYYCRIFYAELCQGAAMLETVHTAIGALLLLHRL